MADSSVAGYVGGGIEAARVNTIQKVAFPADTVTTLSATLTSGRTTTGMADSGVAGYFGGGSTPTPINAIDKITFPADTKSTLAATLTNIGYGNGAFADIGIAGYFGGGYDSSTGTEHTAIDKIAFPSDTKTTLAATLTNPNYFLAGFANCGVF